MSAELVLAIALSQLSNGEWLSYVVPLEAGQRGPCCQDRMCSLSEQPRIYGTSDRDPPAQPDEALRVFLRKRGDGFDRVLAVRTTCPVDARGQELTKIEGVRVEESVAMLEKHAGDNAMYALALHRGSAATRALIRLAKRDNEAYFWLAEARGREGYEAVRDALDGAKGEDKKQHLVFCLSESDEPEVPGELDRLATSHGDEEIRAAALFWISQKEYPRAEQIIMRALKSDPSKEVRKKAVFALSQLPPERAVPALKQLIHKDQPREIRKEAIFWLAQMGGDEVLPVFDELLGTER